MPNKKEYSEHEGEPLLDIATNFKKAISGLIHDAANLNAIIDPEKIDVEVNQNFMGKILTNQIVVTVNVTENTMWWGKIG